MEYRIRNIDLSSIRFILNPSAACRLLVLPLGAGIWEERMNLYSININDIANIQPTYSPLLLGYLYVPSCSREHPGLIWPIDGYYCGGRRTVAWQNEVIPIPLLR